MNKSEVGETGRLHALIENWRKRAWKMRYNTKDTVVESLIAQRADAFTECAQELSAALREAGQDKP